MTELYQYAPKYADNEDPWGMTVNSFPEIIGEFTPASPEQAGKICGLDKAIDPVHIIEHGPVRTVVEAIFLYKRSAAIVHYKFQPITNKLDLEIHLQWNEPNHMVKLSLPTPWKDAECWGQKMLGRARLYENGTENVSQKWISVCNDKLGLTILNRGSYGSSFENGELRLTLLRSPAYTCLLYTSYRCLTLSRAAYLGAQKYGTTFWSSDIFPEWDVLKRQIPTALNFCASGMPYWSSDIGGWQALPDEDTEEDYSKLLIQTSGSGKRSSHQEKLYGTIYQMVSVRRFLPHLPHAWNPQK